MDTLIEILQSKDIAGNETTTLSRNTKLQLYGDYERKVRGDKDITTTTGC